MKSRSLRPTATSPSLGPVLAEFPLRSKKTCPLDGDVAIGHARFLIDSHAQGRCPVFVGDGVEKTSEGPLFGPTRLAGDEEYRTKPRAEAK
jgi:hypothetical protein